MPVLAHDVYTDQTDLGPYVIFPTHAHQILSNCVDIVAVSVLAYCFARRTENDRFTSWLWWTNLTWARFLIILIFLDSWIFLAFSAILVNGVGLSYSVPVCSLGIFGCIFFYAGSKGLTYLFLVERVWVVYSAGKSVTRMESRIYRGCAIIVFGYIGVVTVMILGRFASIRADGVCVIGLQSFATIPLLTYDLFINIFLTSMFLWFLCREQSTSERIRRLARRTAFAAGIALTTSCINILILALLQGKQLGWVCLSSCAADVTINALVLFWVTGGAAREPYWHGPWEFKDGAYPEPHELPPLHFPVSFVEDPEAGLNRARSVDASVQPQTQARSIAARFLHLGEMRQKEFCQGSSKDGHTAHERRRCEDDDVGEKTRSESGDKEVGGDDEKCVAPEEIEWDIAESASSGNTHFDYEDSEDATAEKIVDRNSWRLTLDLELQRSPILSTELAEPDSPATHNTGESRVRLTRNAASRLRTPSRSVQKQQKEPKKQRRRQWHARSLRARARSRPRSVSSPPTSPLRSSPPDVVSNSIEDSYLTPSSCSPLNSPSSHFPPCARRTVLRSQSDSFVRVSDLTMFRGSPRLSQ